jgi:hypothetical protein
MLDSDLAELYRVETRALVQSVKRNIERFPEDFMFQLATEEAEAMRSQTAIASGVSTFGRGSRPLWGRRTQRVSRLPTARSTTPSREGSLPRQRSPGCAPHSKAGNGGGDSPRSWRARPRAAGGLTIRRRLKTCPTIRRGTRRMRWIVVHIVRGGAENRGKM